MRYSLEPMLRVVDQLRQEKCEDPSCPACVYLDYDKLEDSTVAPDGFECSRERNAFVKQCPVHDRPRRQWLVDADRTAAAQWLVNTGNEANGPFIPDYADWQEALQN